MFLYVFMQLSEERLAEEMSMLQHAVESLNYRLADKEDENTELKNRLEREANEKKYLNNRLADKEDENTELKKRLEREENEKKYLNYWLADKEDANRQLKNQLKREEKEKEHYKAAGTKLDSMLNSADAAADELEVKFDNEREVKYVGIIFMHCDTL